MPVVYLPFRAEAPAAVTLIVRGSGGSARVVSAARQAANAIDPDLALGVVRTLDELRDRSRGDRDWSRSSRRSAAWRSSFPGWASIRRWRTP